MSRYHCISNLSISCIPFNSFGLNKKCKMEYRYGTWYFILAIKSSVEISIFLFIPYSDDLLVLVLVGNDVNCCLFRNFIGDKAMVDWKFSIKSLVEVPLLRHVVLSVCTAWFFLVTGCKTGRVHTVDRRGSQIDISDAGLTNGRFTFLWGTADVFKTNLDVPPNLKVVKFFVSSSIYKEILSIIIIS